MGLGPGLGRSFIVFEFGKVTLPEVHEVGKSCGFAPQSQTTPMWVWAATHQKCSKRRLQFVAHACNFQLDSGSSPARPLSK